jgi:KaiC/GvpD/RAD55 family RecA-like ATPase
MTTNTDHTYDLSDVVDVDVTASIRPGASVLLAGPTMTGKQDLLLDVLAAGVRDGQGGVVVTTGDPGAALLGEVESRAEDPAARQLGAVDCRADSNRRTEKLDSGGTVHHVASPSELTAIGISITECFENLRGAGVEDGRLALSSLSTMLTYSDREAVFKFCHVLSARLDSAGFLGLFTVDSTAHDERTMQVVKQAFDGLVEIRERDGVREARVLGLDPEPSAWVEL